MVRAQMSRVPRSRPFRAAPSRSRSMYHFTRMGSVPGSITPSAISPDIRADWMPADAM